jgi:hypothetical protein
MQTYELPANPTDYKLKKVMSDLGLATTAPQRRALLGLSHRTRREYINKMLTDGGSEFAPRQRVTKLEILPPLPKEVTVAGKTYRPAEIIDGFSSTATYAVAALSAVGMIAIRRLRINWFNVKFYDSTTAMGMSDAQLAAMGGIDFLTRNSGKFQYRRCHMSGEALLKLFSLLYGRKNLLIVEPRKVAQLLACEPEMLPQLATFEKQLCLPAPAKKQSLAKRAKKAIKKTVKSIKKAVKQANKPSKKNALVGVVVGKSKVTTRKTLFIN